MIREIQTMKMGSQVCRDQAPPLGAGTETCERVQRRFVSGANKS